MKLSVIIVSYNVRYFLEQCLQSVEKAAKHVSIEIILIDNASIDGSYQMVLKQFPEITAIKNENNVGFAKANNIGISHSTGEYILLLNPDTVIEEYTFKKIIDFMDDHQDAGGLGVQMVDGNGQFLPESKRGLPTPLVAFYKIFGLSALFPKSKIFGKYHLGYLNKNEIHKVAILSGAFMLLRRSALEKTGLLDERFFMYGEDIDLSYRLLLAGYNNYYFPKTRIIHYKGESTKKSSINYVVVFYRAMVIFAKKHFSKKRAKVLQYLIQIAILFRASIALLNRGIQTALMPFIDYAGFIGGLFILRYLYTQHTGIIYADSLVNTAFIIYSTLWVLGIWISGGYNKPVKLLKCITGIALGTTVILTTYALLDETYRFSRALILMGLTWSVIYAVVIRIILHLTNLNLFKLGGIIKKRFAIVGSSEERKRVLNLLKQTHYNLDFAIEITTRPNNEPEEKRGFIAQLHQLQEVVKIFKLDEVIFCVKSIEPDEIINQMSLEENRNVNYKIAHPESLYIIGSNSIKSKGELYSVVDINSLTKPECKRNKRVFDILLSMLIIISFPILIFFIRNPWKLFADVVSVIFGYKTWVGYSKQFTLENLPKLKPSILTLTDVYEDQSERSESENVNLLYAKDYKMLYDLNVVLKGFKSLIR